MKERLKLYIIFISIIFLSFSLKERYDFYIAKKSYEKGKYKEALLIYSQYTKEKKNSSLLNFNIATTYLKMKMYDAAKKHFDRALKFAKDKELKKDILFNLAYLMYLKGNKIEALNLFKKSAIIDSKDILCKKNIEILLSEKNKDRSKSDNEKKTMKKNTFNRKNFKILNYINDAEKISLNEFLKNKAKKSERGEKYW